MGRFGIMLAGHGSTMAFNKGVLEMQAGLLRDRGYDNVYIGFNETSIPSIREALDEMAKDGYDEVLIIPFFVASGLHIMRDIPEKHLGWGYGQTEGTVDCGGRTVTVHLEQPFGEDPNLTDILVERVEELRTSGKDTRILIMGHGSRLDFNSDLMELNRSRLMERGYDKVFVGYNEFNEPKIEVVVLSMIDGGAEEIIALPLFISLGKHLTMDVPAKLGIENFSDGGTVRRNGREVEVKYALPVGGDPRLADVLAAKIGRYE